MDKVQNPRTSEQTSHLFFCGFLCPSARCASAPSVVCRDVDVFDTNTVSLNRILYLIVVLPYLLKYEFHSRKVYVYFIIGFWDVG
jgi:hypothetical protein